MLSNEYGLKYNPPTSLFYIAIVLISFTFSLTFFEYSSFLGSKSNNDKNPQAPLSKITNLIKNHHFTNSTKKEEENPVNIANKKDEEIKDLKNEEKNKEKQERANTDIKQDAEIKIEKKDDDDKKEDIDKKDKRKRRYKKNREDDDNKEPSNNENTKKEEESKSEDESTPIFKDGRTFDHLYSKTQISPFYSKEFPKLEADTEKMEAVKEAFLHAWKNYDKFCFGHDSFHPKTCHCEDKNLGGGLTLIDSISTIIIMGLEEPYKKVRNFVKNNFAPRGTWSLFEFNIRYLGGLLSAYSLSHDKVFKKAAVGLGDAVNEIMESSGGFFQSTFSLKTVDQSDYKYRASGSKANSYILAECGTYQLEFFKLAEITGEDKYVKSATSVYKKLWRDNPDKGLITTHIGAGTDSYYEYIIKSYLMTGGVGKEMLHRHILMMNDIKSKLVFKTINQELVGIGAKSRSKYPDAEVEHLATFAGGMIALGSVKNNENHEEDLKLASDVTTTYAKTYAAFKSGIMPEHVEYNVRNENDKEDIKMVVDGYILRPETVESIFYLYRFTGDQKFRDYNWQIFKAINKSCRVENGFTSITKLQHDPEDVRHRDEMESFFLAETLKYLYLTFTDSSLISPTEWVFNTEAHPLHMWNKDTIEKFSNEIDIQISKSLNREKIREIEPRRRKLKDDN